MPVDPGELEGALMRFLTRLSCRLLDSIVLAPAPTSAPIDSKLSDRGRHPSSNVNSEHSYAGNKSTATAGAGNKAQLELIRSPHWKGGTETQKQQPLRLTLQTKRTLSLRWTIAAEAP